MLLLLVTSAPQVNITARFDAPTATLSRATSAAVARFDAPKPVVR